MPVPVGEDLEIWDGIGEVLKGRTDRQVGAEVFPNIPLGSGGGGSRRNNSTGNRFLRSAEVAEEIMVGGMR